MSDLTIFALTFLSTLSAFAIFTYYGRKFHNEEKAKKHTLGKC